MNPKIYWLKQEAFNIRQYMKLEQTDLSGWIAGQYVAEVINGIFSKTKKEYPKRPMLVEPMDKRLKEKRRVAELVKFRETFLARARNNMRDER